MIKKAIAAVYMPIRRMVAGHGLTQFESLRKANLHFEKWMKGAPKDKITVDGFTIYLDPHQSLLQTFWEYESETTKYLMSVAQEGDVIADVGASIGWFTLHLSRKIGNGKIYAFEPHPPSFSLLNKNLVVNSCMNVEPVHVAIGDHDGKGLLTTVGENWTASNCAGDASTLNLLDEDNKEVRNIEVPVRSLDSFFADRKPPRIIKVDTEGFEEKVMAGAKNVLHSASVLVLEHPSKKAMEELAHMGFKHVKFLDRLNHIFEKQKDF